MRIAAFALCFIAAAISVWIVVPGPVPALFILTVGATELWPLVALMALAGSLLAFRLPAGRLRSSSLVLASAATACALVPPIAYGVAGPRVPLRAFLSPWPMVAHHAPDAGAPAVLAIYGGAWQRGSPQNDAALNGVIRSWGYRVTGLQYPHAPAAVWPAQLDAILRQIDDRPPGPIVLLGHSSGAQLALIAAAMRPRRISGVIVYESPVDLRLGYEYPSHPDIINARKIMSDLCGGTPVQRPACYRSASPRYAVHAGMPPVLMIAAGRDHVVNRDFEHLLRDELIQDGVRMHYVELPWADHAFETVAGGFHNRIALWYVRRFLDGFSSGGRMFGGRRHERRGARSR